MDRSERRWRRSQTPTERNVRKRRSRSRSLRRLIKYEPSLTSISNIRPPPRDKTYIKLERILARINRRIDFITGDGNCFFRALSKEMMGNEKYYDSMRHSIVDYMQKHKSLFSHFIEVEQNIEEHLERMRHNKVWATTAELFGAATQLKTDIYLFTPVANRCYQWFYFRPLWGRGPDIDYIALCHTDATHFDRIIPKDMFDNSTYPPPACNRNFLDFFLNQS